MSSSRSARARPLPPSARRRRSRSWPRSSTTRSRRAWWPTSCAPGGNVTGISSFGGEVFAKRLQLLKEFVPSFASRRRAHEPRHRFAHSPRCSSMPSRRRDDASACAIRAVRGTAPRINSKPPSTAMKRDGCDGILVLADATFCGTIAHGSTSCSPNTACRRSWGDRDCAGRRWTGVRTRSDFPAIFRRAASNGRCHPQRRQAGGHSLRTGDQARARHQPEVGDRHSASRCRSPCSSPPTTSSAEIAGGRVAHEPCLRRRLQPRPGHHRPRAPRRSGASRTRSTPSSTASARRCARRSPTR